MRLPRWNKFSDVPSQVFFHGGMTDLQFAHGHVEDESTLLGVSFAASGRTPGGRGRFRRGVWSRLGQGGVGIVATVNMEERGKVER